jgi:hypothetical protein
MPDAGVPRGRADAPLRRRKCVDMTRAQSVIRVQRRHPDTMVVVA